MTSNAKLNGYVSQPFQKTNRSSPKSRDRSTSKASGATTVDFASSEALAHFEDEQMVHLPYSVVAYEWKPASQVFPEASKKYLHNLFSENT